MSRHEWHTRALGRLISLGLALSVASGHAQLASAGPGSVGFLAIGPAGLEIKGQASALSVREIGSKIQIEVPLGQLETGIGLRDRHLREHMHVDQHPSATLIVDRASLSFPDDHALSQGSARGALRLNGKEHPLEFTYQAKRQGIQYQVQALANLDIRNHGIEVPCYLKICVEPVVKLKVKLSLKDD